MPCSTAVLLMYIALCGFRPRMRAEYGSRCSAPPVETTLSSPNALWCRTSTVNVFGPFEWSRWIWLLLLRLALAVVKELLWLFGPRVREQHEADSSRRKERCITNCLSVDLR